MDISDIPKENSEENYFQLGPGIYCQFGWRACVSTEYWVLGTGSGTEYWVWYWVWYWVLGTGSGTGYWVLLQQQCPLCSASSPLTCQHHTRAPHLPAPHPCPSPACTTPVALTCQHHTRAPHLPAPHPCPSPACTTPVPLTLRDEQPTPSTPACRRSKAPHSVLSGVTPT